jgi:predicted nucleotidyltransferase component of viral defense system
MTPGKNNMSPESVHARLLNEARKLGEDYQVTFMRYLIERFLYRLSKSRYHGQYILKGAMLFRLWEDLPYRTTLDLDLLHRGKADANVLGREMREICGADIEDDGVQFDSGNVSVEPIRRDQEYQGQRVVLTGYLGKSNTRIQIDVGIGDAPWPIPVSHEYPTILGFPAPKLPAYERESVIAEKLEAMVTLGLANSRIKDFFDIHHLATRYSFDGTLLTEVVRRTFERRKTPISDKLPIALTGEFWEATERSQHIRAFARRARIDVTPKAARDLAPLLRAFLWPLMESAAGRASLPGTWPSGGPWGNRIIAR